ncbi:MAG: hypothetical protein KDN18_05965 [Verrucomicrobiae bacterium]|nr:hypothetical protein [Verrucomicrobiae bacterium]
MNDSPFLLGATADVGWLSKKSADQPIVRECFLAVEGGEVRGGFVLRKQDFILDGQVRTACNYQGPISEGIWDRRFALLGVQMLRAALRQEPLLYCLGMGNREQPLPKLLSAAGWPITEVPFRFKVVESGAFLREMRVFKKNRLLKWLSQAGRFSGLGQAGIAAYQGIRGGWNREAGLKVSIVHEFGDWCDGIWTESREANRFTAVRDRNSQNCLFVRFPGKNLILRMENSERVVGWAVVRATQMEGDKYFGNLRVGSLVDCMCLNGSERDVIDGAERTLRGLGCQLILSNQTQDAWLAGMDRNGWLSGPSNFLISLSPQLAKLVGDFSESLGRLHFNRADGDGPIHL